MRRLVFIGLFMITWMCTASHCAMDYEYPIYLQNNSDIDLITNDSRYPYPDTIMRLPNHTVQEMVASLAVKPHSTKSIAGGSALWESIYEVNYPADTMSIFIVACDTLLKYDWEQVRDDHKILVRYDLSLQDLKKNNFTIVYPPNEAMSKIKMWPPYGSQ